MYERLARAIHGIIFFGVPHDGMDINGLMQMAGDRMNRTLVQSLGNQSSSVLSDLRRDFNDLLQKLGHIEIFCFYETEESNTPSKVWFFIPAEHQKTDDPQDVDGKWKMEGRKAILVSKTSATHCRASECDLHHMCAIARSHSEIVKFGRHDPEYDKVRGIIRLVAQGAVVVKCASDDPVTLNRRCRCCCQKFASHR